MSEIRHRVNVETGKLILKNEQRLTSEQAQAVIDFENGKKAIEFLKQYMKHSKTTNAWWSKWFTNVSLFLESIEEEQA